jgi:Tfp pilus assembly protein PilZ
VNRKRKEDNMKKKPVIVYIVSILHFLSPLWYLGQILYIQNIREPGLNMIEKIIRYPDVLYVVVLMVWALAAGVGIYLVSRVGYWLFVSHSAWVLVSWIIIYVRTNNMHPIMLVLGIVGIISTIFVIALLLQKSILSPFFNPRIRWWKNPPRYLVSNSEQLSFKSICDDDSCKVYDINVNGCFLTGKDFHNRYKIGDEYDFQLFIKGHPIHVAGTIVWINPPQSDNGKPAGIGVKFRQMDLRHRKELKHILKVLSEEKNFEESR